MVAELDTRTATLIKENQAKPPEEAVRTRAGVHRNVAQREPLAVSETDFQIARAALHDANPAVLNSGVQLAQALAERSRKAGSRGGLARIRAELADALVRKEGAPAVLANTNFAWWHPANTAFGYQPATGWPADYWTAQDGLVAHLAGSGVDLLLFDYPLAGTYELSVDVYDGPWAEAAITHNALIFEPSSGQNNGQVSQIGEFQGLIFPAGLSRRNAFNTISIQVSPKQVRYLVNGHLFFEDSDPAAGGPWLGLYTQSDRHSVWRRLRMTGEPVIPREVKLCTGDRLDGWISGFYNETQPRRLTGETLDQYGNVINGAAHEPTRAAPPQPGGREKPPGGRHQRV